MLTCEQISPVISSQYFSKVFEFDRGHRDISKINFLDNGCLCDCKSVGVSARLERNIILHDLLINHNHIQLLLSEFSHNRPNTYNPNSKHPYIFRFVDILDIVIRKFRNNLLIHVEPYTVA